MLGIEHDRAGGHEAERPEASGAELDVSGDGREGIGSSVRSRDGGAHRFSENSVLGECVGC